jgi:hypothetical protein
MKVQEPENVATSPTPKDANTMETPASAYIDQDVLSALVKRDMPKEEDDSALELLRRLSQEGRILLFVSDVHGREIHPFTFRRKEEVEQLYASSPKAPFVDDHTVLGGAAVGDQYGGSVWYPLVADHPTSRKLREMGLDRTDAHHLVIAIQHGFKIFLTFDGKIRHHRVAIEKAFQIRVLTPTELVRELDEQARSKKLYVVIAILAIGLLVTVSVWSLLSGLRFK